MENQLNDNDLSGQVTGQHQKENQLNIPEQVNSAGYDYDEAKKDLNSKIMKLTTTMLNHYPELIKYLEEMPATIPNENKPEMTLSHLKNYYESLNSILNNYKLEHPGTELFLNNDSR